MENPWYRDREQQRPERESRVPRSTLKKLFQPILIPVTRLQYLMAKVCKAVAEISLLIPSIGLMFAVYHCRPNLSKYINDVAYERKSWNNVDFLECCISLLCVTVMSGIRELYHARGVQILVVVRRGKLLEFGQNTKNIVPKFYEFTNNWLPFENITLTGEGFWSQKTLPRDFTIFDWCCVNFVYYLFVIIETQLWCYP